MVNSKFFIIFLILVIIILISLFYFYGGITYQEPKFDVRKYQGKFYEVYKQNAFFASQCQAATANYELSPDGKLNVNNICYSVDGTGKEYTKEQENLKELTRIKGFATKTNNPLVFDIEFEFGQRGVYRIFYTDYEFSIVGDLKTNYLSILSRTPYISPKKLLELKNISLKYGFKLVE